MGNWAIHIEGVGAHHNDKDYDADAIFRKFVKELGEAGQSVIHASITHGGADFIKE